MAYTLNDIIGGYMPKIEIQRISLDGGSGVLIKEDNPHINEVESHKLILESEVREVEQLRRELADLQSTLDGIPARISALEGEIDDLNQLIPVFVAQRDADPSAIERGWEGLQWRARRNANQRAIDELEQQRNAKRGEVGFLQARQRAAEARLDEITPGSGWDERQARVEAIGMQLENISEDSFVTRFSVSSNFGTPIEEDNQTETCVKIQLAIKGVKNQRSGASLFSSWGESKSAFNGAMKFLLMIAPNAAEAERVTQKLRDLKHGWIPEPEEGYWRVMQGDMLTEDFMTPTAQLSQQNRETTCHRYDITDLIDPQQEQVYRTDQDGNQIFEFTFTPPSETFSTPTRLQNLKIFVVPYIEPKGFLDNLVGSANGEVNALGGYLDDLTSGAFREYFRSLLRYFIGPVTEFTALHTGRVVGEKAIFVDTTTGVRYDGPVHYHGPRTAEANHDGAGDIGYTPLTSAEENAGVQPYYMGGVTHDPNQEQPIVERRMVRTGLVQDSRLTAKLEAYAPDLGATDIPEFQPRIKLQGDSQASITDIASEYITDMHVSIDHDKDVTMFFGINVESIMRNKTLFGGLYEHLTESEKSEVLGLFSLQAVRILRRRVNQEAVNINRLGGQSANQALFDPPQSAPAPTVVIEVSGEDISAASSQGRGREKRVHASWVKVGDWESLDWTFEEVTHFLALDNDGRIPGADYSPPIRFFTANDRTAMQLLRGVYQYGVEFDFLDNTLQFFKDRASTLRTQLAHLSQYYQAALEPTSYNAQANRFTELFVHRFWLASEDGAVHEADRYRLEAPPPLPFPNPIPEVQMPTEGIVEGKTSRFWRTYAVANPLSPGHALAVRVPAEERSDILISAAQETRYADALSFDMQDAMEWIWSNTGPFLRLLELLSERPESFDMDSATATVSSFTDPECATRETILRIINIMQTLLQKLEDLVGVSHIRNSANASDARRSPGRASKLVKVSRYSTDTFDADYSYGNGYYYTPLTPSINPRDSVALKSFGIKKFKEGALQTLLNYEREKSWGGWRPDSFARAPAALSPFIIALSTGRTGPPRGGPIGRSGYPVAPRPGRHPEGNEVMHILPDRRRDIRWFVHNPGGIYSYDISLNENYSPLRYTTLVSRIRQMNQLKDIEGTNNPGADAVYYDHSTLVREERQEGRLKELKDYFSAQSCTVFDRTSFNLLVPRVVEGLKDTLLKISQRDDTMLLDGRLDDESIASLRLSASAPLVNEYFDTLDFMASDTTSLFTTLLETDKPTFGPSALAALSQDQRNKVVREPFGRDVNGVFARLNAENMVVPPLPLQIPLIAPGGSLGDIALRNARVPTGDLANDAYGSFVDIHLNKIVKIEVLEGFEESHGQQVLQRPIWRQVYSQDFINSGRNMLCRLTPYRLPELNLGHPAYLEMPVFDRYFFVSGRADGDVHRNHGSGRAGFRPDPGFGGRQ